MLTLGLAGCGRVGSQIAAELDLLGCPYMLGVYDRHLDRAQSLCGDHTPHRLYPLVNDLVDFHPRFLIEAASRDFVAQEVPQFLAKGTSVLCLSSGILADSEVRSNLLAAAESGNSKLYLPATPPATDVVAVLQLAGLREARYRSSRGIGHPRARTEGEGVSFSGSVQSAMMRFDRALNPAAALAEVAIGYEATIVEVAFESRIRGYEFLVEADSPLGHLRAILEGPVDGDWTFSRWAVLSTVALLIKLQSRLVIGL